MPKKSGPPSKLSAEEKRIEKQRMELLRKQRELEARLVALPAVIEKQREMIEKQARQRAQQASAPISPGRGRTGKRPARRHGMPPSKRAQAAKLQALALLMLFALILFLVWRAIPSN